MPLTPEEFFAKLEERGEQEIEANLAKGIYGADKRPLVELCLTRKKLARTEAARAEEMGIARSAKNAAWAAAAFAALAALAAVIALLK